MGNCENCNEAGTQCTHRWYRGCRSRNIARPYAAGDPIPTSSETLVEVPVLIPLSHPVSLQDAMAAAASNRMTIGSAVGGYKFEGDVVAGEYWPTEDLPPDKFLSEFQSATGTLPEVVGLLTMKSVSLEEAQRVEPTETLSLDAQVFVAPPSAELPASKAHELMAARAKQESTFRVGATTLTGGDTPQPRDAYVNVRPSAAFANTVEITQYYDWYGVDPFSSPLVIPNHWGMEFGVDLTTELPQYQVGNRPTCWPGYEEATAATNDLFTFWVMVIDGTEYIGSPGPAGFYGDYFDHFDACARTSITVGAADPNQIPWSTYTGASTLYITILATKGNEATSRVSGNIQAIERYSCESTPSTPLTVCMGLDENISWPGPGSQTQLTKNTSTVWYAPSRCWYTPDFGSAAYDIGCTTTGP